VFKVSVLVGRKAPDFSSPTILGNGEVKDNFKLSEAVKDKYALLFFYPLNFTFVCPSELIALDKRLAQFKERNVEVIGISIDSHFTHKAWRNMPIEQGGIGPVGFPLVSDVSHKITQAYGIEHPEAAVAYRAAFLIDKSQMVRSEIVNDLPLGRNIDELIRLVDALQYTEENGEVCPAGWIKGSQGMEPTSEGVANYLTENAKNL
jgi:peroxiredoxin (alkyl hydroperoxide reductase subunit C)